MSRTIQLLADQSRILLAIQQLIQVCHTNSRLAGFYDATPATKDLLGLIERGQAKNLYSADDYQILAAVIEQLHTLNDGEKIALIHSELSEGFEGVRHGNGPSDHIPEFSMLEEEMADAVIRILDYSGAKELRLGEAILAKMTFNATRAYKHGKTC